MGNFIVHLALGLMNTILEFKLGIIDDDRHQYDDYYKVLRQLVVSISNNFCLAFQFASWTHWSGRLSIFRINIGSFVAIV